MSGEYIIRLGQVITTYGREGSLGLVMPGMSWLGLVSTGCIKLFQVLLGFVSLGC